MDHIVRLSCDTAARAQDEDEFLGTAARGSSPWMSVGQAIERSGIYANPRIAELLEARDRLDIAAS